MVANNIFPLPQPLQQPHATVWDTFTKWLKKKLDAHDSRLVAVEAEVGGAVRRVRVTRNVAQSVGNGAVSAIVWTGTDYNTGEWNSGVNPQRLTCSVAGTYHIDCSLLWDLNASGVRYMSIGVNGGGIVQETSLAFSAAWYMGSSMSCDVYLSVGSYVEALVYQSSGVNLNITPIYPLSLSMHRISA